MKRLNNPYESKSAKDEGEKRLAMAEGTIRLVDTISVGKLSPTIQKNFQTCSEHAESYPPALKIEWNGKPESTGTQQYRDRRDKQLVELYNNCVECREITQTAIRVAIHKEVSGKPFTYHPPDSKEFRLAMLRIMFPHSSGEHYESRYKRYYPNGHSQECCERAAYEGWFKQAGLAPPKHGVTTEEE